jgi:hypothetical protein
MTDWIEVKKEEEEKEKVKFWEPEAIGESLQGKYLDKEENVGQYKSNLYTIRTDKGEEIKCWGSTVLDNLMEKVPLSSEVNITFKGKNPSKTGKNPWKDYKVMYREK